jgi:hypothetical protein
MSREAIKLALEALEYIHKGANNQGPHTGISWLCVSNKAEPAITALREALAEQPAQQEPFGYFKAEPFGWTDCAESDEGAVALYERPQPAQRKEDK